MDHLWKWLWQGVGLVGIRRCMVLREAALGWGGGLSTFKGGKVSQRGGSIVLLVVAEGAV